MTLFSDFSHSRTYFSYSCKKLPKMPGGLYKTLKTILVRFRVACSSIHSKELLERLKDLIFAKFFDRKMPTPPPILSSLGKWWKKWVSGRELAIIDVSSSCNHVSVTQKTSRLFSMINSRISQLLFLRDLTFNTTTFIEGYA